MSDKEPDDNWNFQNTVIRKQTTELKLVNTLKQKKCLTSIFKITTIIRYHYTPMRMSKI